MTPIAETLALRVPLSGVVVSLDRVPDPVFAQRLAGDGVSSTPRAPSSSRHATAA